MPNTAGRIFMSNDPGYQWYRDNGSEWEGWGQFFELFEPDDTDFSWINQGSANVDATNGGVFLDTPGNASDSLRLRVKSPLFSTYAAIAGFMPLLDPIDQTSAGVVFRESATGRIIFLRFMYDTTSSFSKSELVIRLDKYTDPTTFDSTYATLSAGALKGSMVWFRMGDDGSDLTWYFGNDAMDILLVDTQARDDFFTTGPDQIGFAVNSNNASASAGMTLLSLREYEV